MDCGLTQVQFSFREFRKQLKSLKLIVIVRKKKDNKNDLEIQKQECSALGCAHFNL